MSAINNKKLPLKTRFFNLFRLIFLLYPFERLLRFFIVNGKMEFLRKLIPLPLQYRPETFRISEKGGVQFRLDLHQSVDHFIYWLYPESSAERLLELAANSKVILDVGANIGSTALFMANINPEAVIHAFEPHEGNFTKAQKNLSLNKFNKVTFHRFGLGNKNESRKLYEVATENSGMNRILQEDSPLPFTEISIRTMDDFTRGHGVEKVDLIKVDVEGFEMNVLGGAEQTLKSFPVLFIELDDNNLRMNNFNAAMLVNHLRNAGYNSFHRADTMTPISETTDFTDCHFDLIAEKIC
ncbi:MAG: FkbM family methyltransferase [Bacteroidia bacterium]|nr:FkbM family methyltransferase [Bacteroidia bacterium]